MDKRKIGLFVIFSLALLAALVAFRGGLDIELNFRLDPIWVIAGLIAALFGLPLLAKHPAAFVAPMLFAPRVMELPFFSRFAETRSLTVLAVTGAIVGLAIFMRFLWLCRQPGEIWDVFRGQRRGIIAYLLFAAVIALSYLYTAAPDSGWD